MKKSQLIGLGLATLDILVRLTNMPTWEQCTPITELEIEGGGMIGNALVTAARLGVRTGFVGTAGNNALAELKLKTLRSEGIDISRVQAKAIPENQVNLVYVHEKTGDRQFAGNISPDIQKLSVSDLDYTYITAADYILFDGFHHDAAIQVGKWVQELPTTVVLDMGKVNLAIWPPGIEKLIPYTDILICGSKALSMLTGKSNIYDAGKAVLKSGPTLIVQTEGDEGCYTISQTDCFHTPAIKLDQVDIIDTTGAGDAFHGAYIVGLLHNWDINQIAVFASAVAAHTCTKLGSRAGIPNWADIHAFMNRHGIQVSITV